MKKKKKGKVRWLAVLLAGCLLLSIVPATAFASDDTVPTKSEDAVAEETQMPEEQNATEETKMGAVTPAPKDETKATDNGVSGTSAESKNDKAEDLQPSEQPDAEKKSASVDTSNSVIKKASVDANAENKTEKSDKSNEKSSAEVSTYAAEYDFLPSGVKKDTTYQHAYHTQVNVTANVSVKDSEGTVLETKQVTKSTEEFLKGGVGEIQTELANLQDEIEAPYKAGGTVTRGDGTGQPEFDHFESAAFYTFAPTSGDPVKFSTDLDAAKQYFSEHPDATGTFTEFIDIHEYQKWNYTYDLTVQENSQPTKNTIINVVLSNVTLSYHAGDVPKATAKIEGDPNYEIAYEYWEEMETTSDGESVPVAYWYSDESKNSTLPADKRITSFEEGKTYMYSIMLRAKDGYTFAEPNNGLFMVLNGGDVNAKNISVGADGSTLFAVALKTIKPAQPVERKPIELIEINDATTSFKAGDTPVFTGKVPADALYYIDYEGWVSKDAGVTSSEYWNGRYGDFEGSWGKLLTSFEANTEYTYRIYLKLTGEAVKSGYYFDKEKTKLSINGKIMDMREDSISIEPYPYDDVALFYSVLTMTPEAGGTTPAEKYTVTYTDGVDNEEIFKDQTYTVESGKATPAFNGTPAREGYKFTGWSPAVTDTVTGNVTYTAQWEKVATPAETFTVTYTDGVDNEEIFKDQTYTVESGKATPVFNGTPTRKGYTFAGWKPAVAATVTGNATYEATWKSNSATTTPKDDKSNTGETTSPKTGDTGNGKNSTTLPENKSDTVTTPKTGDTSNIVLWIVLLLVSSGALVGAVVIVKKKKYNR